MHVLPLAELARVVGGKSAETLPDGTVRYQQSNYESCVDAVERGAQQKYPDDRWFFQRWVGAKDGNADARADWVKKSLPEACGLPPK